MEKKNIGFIIIGSIIALMAIGMVYNYIRVREKQEVINYNRVIEEQEVINYNKVREEQELINRARIITMKAFLLDLPIIIAIAEERPPAGATGFCAYPDIEEIIVDIKEIMVMFNVNAEAVSCLGTENAPPTCISVDGIPNILVKGINVTHFCGDYKGNIVLNGTCDAITKRCQ